MQASFDSILSARPDPLEVLKTTAPIVQQARYVKINSKAIEHAADALAQKRVEPPVWNYEYHFFDGTARTVHYLFLVDTLNFCFWSDRARWTIEYKGVTLNGYWALAVSLKCAAEENPHVLDADYLANISPDELSAIFNGKGEIPLFAERWRNVRELGAVLRDRWEGSATRLVESAQGDATRLARMIVESFSSFDDVAIYELGRGSARINMDKKFADYQLYEVRLLKRAQILVSDLWGSFKGKLWGEFKNMDALTAFADYKLPQILRAWGILKYAPSLAHKVDSRIELEAGSAEEVEIRAATLWAVEFLRQSLATRGREFISIQIDWILWETSQGKFKGMKPYHRARTVFY